jgi:hypothetical protein
LSGTRTLRIDLRPSRGFAAAIVALHAAAGTCIALLWFGPAGIVLGLLVCGLGLAAARDRALLRGGRSPRALRLEGKDCLGLESANAGLSPFRLDARRYVSGLLVVLTGNGPVRRTIVVTGDMLDPEAFRLLRLWALWGRLPHAAPLPPAGRVTESHCVERTIF